MGAKPSGETVRELEAYTPIYIRDYNKKYRWALHVDRNAKLEALQEGDFSSDCVWHIPQTHDNVVGYTGLTGSNRKFSLFLRRVSRNKYEGSMREGTFPYGQQSTVKVFVIV